MFNQRNEFTYYTAIFRRLGSIVRSEDQPDEEVDKWLISPPVFTESGLMAILRCGILGRAHGLLLHTGAIFDIGRLDVAVARLARGGIVVGGLVDFLVMNRARAPSRDARLGGGLNGLVARVDRLIRGGGDRYHLDQVYPSSV